MSEHTRTEREQTEAASVATPFGVAHLHRLMKQGYWEWVVRGTRKTTVCSTRRCRIVSIMRVTSSGTDINEQDN